MRELVKRINAFDKENLLDILHYLAEGIERITGNSEIRIYIEDMREGALVCLYTPEGELERKGGRIPIQRRDNNLVKAFLESRPVEDVPIAEGSGKLHLAWAAGRGLTRTTLFPLGLPGQSIGIFCLDAPEGGDPIISRSQRGQIEDFLTKTVSVLKLAHKFYWQIMLNRHLDMTRKKDVARIILTGVFELDRAIEMTSVLIPAESPIPEALKEQRGGYMEILAAASRVPSDVPIYKTLERIGLLEGKSLLSGLVMQGRDSVLPRPDAPDVLFYEDILSEKFDRLEIFQQLSLRTLLMVPVMDESGSVICVVNYFTKKPHKFSEMELGLLVNHANAVGEGIIGPSNEHFEIRVLSEIEQLLVEENKLPVFLNRVVSIASGFVGADSGSIALIQERDEQKWLVVEDEEEEGKLIGAKSMEWRKAHIPPLKVGGEELPARERSLTGNVAYTGKPFLCNDTREEAAKGGFYRELVGDVRSELAVPIQVGETVVGVINLDSFRKDFFSLEHQRILLLISRLIASRIADMIKIDELTRKVARLNREVSYKSPEVSSYLLGNIIGKSEASRQVVERIGKVSALLTNCLLNWDTDEDGEIELGLPTLLITGDTGSGKEFVFNNLYSLLSTSYLGSGGRRGQLLIRKSNIAAYGGDLTYTELFGHKKGAYTGAYSDRIGILEEADGGIVFLDEIADADQKTQVQLLRFLDSGEFTRLGDNQVRRSRVILVAATNKNLTVEIERGSFREDLFHRLNELSVKVPSLAERREDIPDLARHFLSRLHSNYSRGTPVSRLDEKAASMLKELDYPGNIRQLVSILQGALIESSEGVVGEKEVLRALVASRGSAASESYQDESTLYNRIREGEGDFWSLVHAPFVAHEVTKSQVLRIYRMALAEGGNVKGAARILGALPDDDGSKEKALNKFKNFMYKTVGAGKSQGRGNT